MFRRAKDSACQQADPTGFHALQQVKEVRATLRALARAGKITAALEEKVRAIDENRDLHLPCCAPLAVS